MSEKHLLLLDSSGFAYRAYYRFAPRYRDSDGMPTGAVLGFMSLVWRTLGAAQADKPTHAAAIFDAPGKTFRSKIFPEYKANREPARALELEPQKPLLRHAAETMGLTPVECEGFEADDVIATLATMAAKAGYRVTIVSSDKDMGQLVEDGVIEVVDPMQRRRCLAAGVKKKFGVEPALVPHVQALAGDAVDGIPGIPGCGIEKAAALIRRFGSVRRVLAHADECQWATVRVALKRHGKMAIKYLQLTTLRRDAPVTVKLDELALQPVMKSHLVDMLKVLEASDKLTAIFSIDPQFVRVVAHTDRPFGWWEEELKFPGQKVPDAPQCGFYERRLVKNGPWVPARIWREPEMDPVTGEPTGKDLLRCEVNGRTCDPLIEWDRLVSHPLTEAKFRYETADADHAKKYRPGDPKAKPRTPINLIEQPAPRNPRRI